MEKAKFGVLTVSDRASRGEYEDISGKYIIEYLHEVVSSPFEVVYRIVPDERELIEGALIHHGGCGTVLFDTYHRWHWTRTEGRNAGGYGGSLSKDASGLW